MKPGATNAQKRQGPNLRMGNRTGTQYNAGMATAKSAVVGISRTGDSTQHTPPTHGPTHIGSLPRDKVLIQSS